MSAQEGSAAPRKDPVTGADVLHFGGQAILEGVMMRSPRHFAVACRAPNGEILVHEEELEKTWIGKQKWLELPFLRGSGGILDAMTLGVRAMRFAGTVQMETEGEHVELDPTGPAPFAATTAAPRRDVGKEKRIQDIAIGATLVVSLVLGFALFNVLPNAIGSVVAGGRLADWRTSLITEVVKVSFFIGYIALISRMEAIRRVFKYHGAEHKAINALEMRRPLDVPSARASSRFHPRCGTSFAVIVFGLGLLFFPLVPRPHFPAIPSGSLQLVAETLARVGSEIVILPLIAGTAYEALRLAGKFRHVRLVRFVFAPGLWTQRLTTVEPEDDQIEVALAALRACVEAEARAESPQSAPTVAEAAPAVIA